LVEDGIAPEGNAFRNARLALLSSHAGLKDGKVDVSKPGFEGKYSLKESGEGITHDEFKDLEMAQSEALASKPNLFVEDAGLVAHWGVRVGVRVTTNNAAVALIARNLLIPVPPRPSNHMARYNGWNKNPKWRAKEMTVWNGKEYQFEDPNFFARSNRHVVAFVGGATKPDTLAVQFAESEGKVIGSTVLVGDDVPIRGVIEALGHAAGVIIGQEQPNGIVLPSVSLFNGSSTAIVVGADDSVIAGAIEKKVLYGAYHNYVSANGVSALWNGVIGSAETASSPAVTSGGKATTVIAPQNLAHPAKHFIFYKKDGPSGKLTEEEAVKRLVELTDESKKNLCAELVKGANLHIVGSSSAIAAALGK